MKILVGGIFQEANTFSGVRVTYDDFRKYRGEDLIRQLSECQEFLRAGMEVIPAVYAAILPSAPLDGPQFDRFIEDFFHSCQEGGTPDAIYLSLHGAMYIRDRGSGELYLVEKLREKYGQEIPIFASFDFHGNMFPRLAAGLNYATAYKTAPHRDERETGLRAARALVDAMTLGRIPTVRCVQLPMTFPGEMVITDDHPACDILAQVQGLVDDGLALEASWFCGFIWSDAEDIYTSIAVNAYEFGDVLEARLEAAAKQLWQRRRDFHFSTEALPVDAAVALAFDTAAETKKVFLSDSGDNVTAGTSGDSAYMADVLYRAAAKRSATWNGKILVTGIADEMAVARCFDHEVGDVFELGFGGSLDATSHRACGGVTLLGRGYLEAGRSNGRMRFARVLYGAVEVLLNEQRFAYTQLRHFTEAGVDLDAYDIICIKLGYLFPELAAVAGKAIMAFSPGNAPLLATEIPYAKERRFFPRCEVTCNKYE